MLHNLCDRKYDKICIKTRRMPQTCHTVLELRSEDEHAGELIASAAPRMLPVIAGYLVESSGITTMVPRGLKPKYKAGTINEALSRLSFKMAPSSPSQPCTPLAIKSDTQPEVTGIRR